MRGGSKRRSERLSKKVEVKVKAGLELLHG